jgi:8-oxo-dGTP diphosphatase
MSAPEDSSGPRVEIAVAVVERDGEYLIGLRPEGMPLAGFWEFPGGKVAPDETPEKAAIRECLEETGLEVRVTGSYPPVLHEYPHARVRLSFISCAAVQQRQPLPARFHWVAVGDLHKYTFPPANDSLLRQLTQADSHGAMSHPNATGRS